MSEASASQHGTGPAVLITGAAGGIGRAAALLLAGDGWHCVLVDADVRGLQRLATAWPQGAPAPACHGVDLTDAAQIERLGKAVPALDALINNAGMSAGGSEVLAGRENGGGRRLLALNLDAPARLVQACEARLNAGARIVNVASGAGLRAIPWRGLYSPSKAGLIGQGRALARARPDWTVSTLAPGFVRTDLVQGLIDSGRLDPAQAVSRIPLGRMGEPQDMAEALRFLVSSGARPLSGQLLVVDGGSSACGSSQPLPACAHAPLPVTAQVQAAVQAAGPPAWDDVLSTWAGAQAGRTARDTAQAYAAVVDGRAMNAAPGAWLESVLDAATQFRERHHAMASLTLLLPRRGPDIDWALGGDADAARMAVATLAGEWGGQGLRINALELPSDLAPEDGLPVLDFVAGARAQFLTGQVLRLGARRTAS